MRPPATASSPGPRVTRLLPQPPDLVARDALRRRLRRLSRTSSPGLPRIVGVGLDPSGVTVEYEMPRDPVHGASLAVAPGGPGEPVRDVAASAAAVAAVSSALAAVHAADLHLGGLVAPAVRDLGHGAVLLLPDGLRPQSDDATAARTERSTDVTALARWSLGVLPAGGLQDDDDTALLVDLLLRGRRPGTTTAADLAQAAIAVAARYRAPTRVVGEATPAARAVPSPPASPPARRGSGRGPEGPVDPSRPGDRSGTSRPGVVRTDRPPRTRARSTRAATADPGPGRRWPWLLPLALAFVVVAVAGAARVSRDATQEAATEEIAAPGAADAARSAADVAAPPPAPPVPASAQPLPAPESLAAAEAWVTETAPPAPTTAPTTVAPATPLTTVAPTAATTAAVSTAPSRAGEWRAVLEELDRARLAAFAAADPTLLSGADAPGSPAWDRDRTAVQDLARRGLSVAGLSTRLLRVSPVRSGVGTDRVLLEVRDRRSAYALVDELGTPVVRRPAGPPRAWRVTLVRTGDGWRYHDAVPA
ncbi:MAG: hypothetical protein R2737_04255 [Candidatus Nanopelagicales bacterium]